MEKIARLHIERLPEGMSNTSRYTTIPNHPGDTPEGTLRAILKQAAIAPDDFLRDR